MNQNPYQPPQAPVAAYAAPAAQAGQPLPWAVGEVLSTAWERYKGEWPTLTFGTLIVQIISGLPGEIAPALVASGAIEQGSAEYLAIHLPASLIGFFIASFFMVGLVRLYLAVLRGQPADFGTIFGGADAMLPAIGVRFLSTLVVLVGLLLLIVPGVIASLGLMLAPYYVIDQRMGVVDSMKRSWEVTEGQRADLFVYGLASLGIVLLGLMACCLGIFVAAPVVALGQALIYARMSGTIAAAPQHAYGMPGAYPAPPQGGPPYGQGGPPYGQGGPPYGQGGPPPGQY